MIPAGVEIFLAAAPIDLRWGFNRLSGVVVEAVGRDVRCGALFLFVGRRRDALKILFYDGTGICLFYKRLDAGRFRLPQRAGDVSAGAIAIDENELGELLDGIDLEESKVRRACVPARKKRRLLN
jgi:transposase